MIRKYNASDLDALLEAWEAATKLAHPFLSETFLESERDNIPNLYLPNADTWVWETEGRVVGFIALLGNEIGGLFLAPKFHGQGIGRAMVDHARQLKGRLEVEVFQANTIGRTFYDKYGFQQISQSIHEATAQPVLRLAIAAA